MLLYDHVREHAERMLRKCGPEEFRERDLINLLVLRNCVVYEVSSIVPLFGDWSRDKDKAVPKRPPHDPVWAEWRYRDSKDNEFYDDWTLGVCVGAMPENTRRHFLEHPPKHHGGGVSISEGLRADKEYYLVQMFKRLDAFRHDPNNCQAKMGDRNVSFEEAERINRNTLNRPTCDLGTFIWSQNADGSGVHRFKLFPDLEGVSTQQELVARATLFSLDVVGSFGYQPHWQPADPWPPFMAFALLNCKNVVTEEVVPEERIQKECRKHGRPPRVTYKVLRVEVPKTVHVRQTYDGADDESGPRVRFHLCSGHFKNLQHERYKAKGWHWWPAHWRGSKDLGEVHKRYEITPRDS